MQRARARKFRIDPNQYCFFFLWLLFLTFAVLDHRLLVIRIRLCQ